MNKLTEILTKETQELKLKFINSTKAWAISHHKSMSERVKWNEEKWCKYFGLEPRLANPNQPSIQFYSFPNGFYNTKDAREYNAKKNEAIVISSMPIEAYISKELNNAENHYNLSIEKLAFRIDKKNLNINDLKVNTSSIGVNIETILTDGKQVVKAFTIIAEGQIQRPHYRYLIK